MFRRLVLAALFLPCVVTHAQEPLRFSSAADLVVLHVNVSDKKGRGVSGLPRDAFSVFEDRRLQTISFFTSDDLPVTAGLLIDSSISMYGVRDLAIAGAVAFAEASHRGDEIFALAFNEHVRSALPSEAPFTNDATVLRDALMRVMTARGRTGLFDAIAGGLEYAARGEHHRKVLVVISDGGDNASTTTFADVLTRTQAANVVVYAVVLDDPAGREGKPKVMKQLAEQSGGQVFTPRSVREISDVLRRIAADIRRAYTIGYVPATPADGRFRRLSVQVVSPERQALVVRSRSGYVAQARKSGT